MSDALSVALAAGHVSAVRNVSLETTHGTYHLAGEPCSWSGLFFLPRLLGVGALVTEVGGPAEGLVGVARTTIRLANADGWATRVPPEFFRGRLATVRDVILSVESTPLKSWTFRMTALRATSPEEVEIACEDQWAQVRRDLVPNPRALIDRTKFPNMREGSPAIGQPIPLVYGRCRVPLVLVDDTVEDTKWVACVGSATLSGSVTEIFNDQHSLVQSAALEYGLAGSDLPVTYVRIASPIYAGGQPTVHYADLTGPVGGRPDRVLLDWFTGPGGVGYSGTICTSDSLVTAQAFYEAHSLGFDCVLGQQRPLEQWLGDWSRDALTRILLRDQLVLAPQRSLAPVASFTTASILYRTLTTEDTAIREATTVQQVRFTDRTQSTSGGGELVASYAATVGGTVGEYTSPLIGMPSVAQRDARFYATQALLAARGWTLGASIRASSLEPGDLVTLTHSETGPEQFCEVTRMSRDGWRIDVALRQSSSGLYAITSGANPLPTDPSFTVTFQQINFVTNPNSTANLRTGATSAITVQVSHQLGLTPVAALPRFRKAGEPVIGSLTLANDSTAQIRLEGFTGLSTVPLNLSTELLHFELRA